MPLTEEVSSTNEDAPLPPLEMPLLAIVPLTTAAPEAPTEATDAASVDPTATATLATTITPTADVREGVTLGVEFINDRQVGNAGRVFSDGSYSAAAGRPAAQNCLFIASIPGTWKATWSEVIPTSTLRMFPELRRASSTLQCTEMFAISTCRASDLFVDDAAALSIASEKMTCTDLLRSSGDIGISSTRSTEILFVAALVLEDVGTGVVVDVLAAALVLLLDDDAAALVLDDVGTGVVVDVLAAALMLVLDDDAAALALDDVGAGVVVDVRLAAALLDVVGVGVLEVFGAQALMLLAAVTDECLPVGQLLHLPSRVQQRVGFWMFCQGEGPFRPHTKKTQLRNKTHAVAPVELEYFPAGQCSHNDDPILDL